MAAPTNGNVTVVIPPQHPRYYLQGGDLHVIAGGALFRVHGFFFSRDSNIFKTRLNPVSPGQTREGTSPDSPVVLDGVTANEFEKLLWVFYNPRYSLYDADIDEWKTILRLAHTLEFKEVKELAVRELHMKRDFPLVEKMALYQQHQVDSRHLVPLFAELCARDTALTLEESEILGPQSTFLVYSTRERLRARPSDGGRSPLPDGLEESDIFRAIESSLGIDQGSTLAFHQANNATNTNHRTSSSTSSTRGARGMGVGTLRTRR